MDAEFGGGVLRHEVTGIRVAAYGGMRVAALPLRQEQLGEDPVPHAPADEQRDARQRIGPSVRRAEQPPGRVVVPSRYASYVLDGRPPVLQPRVRTQVGAAHLRRKRAGRAGAETEPRSGVDGPRGGGGAGAGPPAPAGRLSRSQRRVRGSR